MPNWWSDLTDTIPRWLGTLRSPNGLYRMSASAYHSESLDATTLALDLLQMLGQRLKWRLSWRDGVRAFIQGRQSQDSDGLFSERFWGDLDIDVPRAKEMADTYSSHQVAGVFLKLGWWPWRPINFYSQFLRPGAISRYMTDNMPWDTKPMGAGNMVDAAATMCRMNIAMGHYEYWHVITEMYRWLDEHQDMRHGFWGNGGAQGICGIVQAGYHILRGLHFRDGRRLVWDARMFRSIATCLQYASVPLDACHYMDCAVLLEHLVKGYGGSAAVSPARKLIDDIRIMRREDGGFSFSAEGAITNHNRYEVTPGAMESDLVGTVFYLQALRSALRVLGEEVPWGESATHGVRRA